MEEWFNDSCQEEEEDVFEVETVCAWEPLSVVVGRSPREFRCTQRRSPRKEEQFLIVTIAL